jgi:hypothetical protein
LVFWLLRYCPLVAVIRLTLDGQPRMGWGLTVWRLRLLAVICDLGLRPVSRPTACGPRTRDARRRRRGARYRAARPMRPSPGDGTAWTPPSSARAPLAVIRHACGYLVAVPGWRTRDAVPRHGGDGACLEPCCDTLSPAAPSAAMPPVTTRARHQAAGLKEKSSDSPLAPGSAPRSRRRHLHARGRHRADHRPRSCAPRMARQVNVDSIHDFQPFICGVP